MTVEEFIAAGVYDPAIHTAGDRLALLQWLVDQGFTLDELRVAAQDNTLTRLAADRKLSGGSTTVDAAAIAKSGLTAEMLASLTIAAGLSPSTVPMTRLTIELFHQFDIARQMFTPEAAMHFLRVMGSSLGRIAEAANTMFLIDVEVPLVSEHPNQFELAKTMVNALTVLEGLDDAMIRLFRLHMNDAVVRSRTARVFATDPEQVPMVIGFIDLVGFTSISQVATTHELMDLVLDFEGRAYDLVTQHGGRVVKFIGDEVMFTTIDPASAATIVQKIFAELHQRDVTPRAGLAYGQVLPHGGDYYGSTVNLASRVADIAVPFEILVTREFAMKLPEEFVIEPAGRRQLKGFTDPVELCSLHVENAPAAR